MNKDNLEVGKRVYGTVGDLRKKLNCHYDDRPLAISIKNNILTIYAEEYIVESYDLEEI